MVQYSSVLKASISASRSHTSRSATDCTRPAERAPGQLAPQHGRQGEAHEVVQRPAGQIGLDQGRIDLARGLEGVQHRLLGDGVEGHPLDGHALLQGLLLFQDAQDVPGNGLSLAIGVGGQDQLVGGFDGRGDLLHHLLGAPVHVPVHLEVLVGLDGAVLGRQIPHVPIGRQHLVAGAQVLVDRLGLGDGFDNNDVHAGVTRLPRPMPSGAARIPCCWYFCPVAARTWWTKGAMSNQPASLSHSLQIMCDPCSLSGGLCWKTRRCRPEARGRLCPRTDALGDLGRLSGYPLSDTS